MNTIFFNTCILSLLLLFSNGTLAHAQQAAQNDLQRKSDVLAELLSSQLALSDKKLDNQSWRASSNQPQVTTFATNSGVFFRVKLQPNFGVINRIMTPDMIESVDVRKGKDGNTNVIVRGKAEVSSGTDTKTAGSKDTQEEERKAYEAQQQQEYQDLKTSISTFLRDYTLVLTELNDDAQIHVNVVNDKVFQISRFGNNNNAEFETTLELNTKPIELSASIAMKDVRDFAKGKLDKEAFEKSVRFTTGESAKTPKDIQVYGDVLRGLYERNNTLNYFSSRDTEIISLGELGWSMNVKLYSSYRSGNRFTIVAQEQAQPVSQKEKDRFVLDTYPDWKEEFMGYLVDYGITLRSLEGQKKLMVYVELPECYSFDQQMPDAIRFELTAKLVDELRKGKLSREQAIAKLQYLEEN